MQKFTFPLEFPHVEMHQKMRISARWEIHNFWCISTCGNARSHVNFHIGKSVFPPARIYTYFCAFPHAVIHLKMCKSTSAEYTFPHVGIHIKLCISACGNTRKFVFIRTVDIHIFWCISTSGNSQF